MNTTSCELARIPITLREGGIRVASAVPKFGMLSEVRSFDGPGMSGDAVLMHMFLMVDSD